MESNKRAEKVRALVAVKKDLMEFMWEYGPQLDAVLHNAVTLSPESVLQLANSLSHTAFAPKGWAPGFYLNGHPPAPLCEEMRAGYLEKYNAKIRAARQIATNPKESPLLEIPIEAPPEAVKTDSIVNLEQEVSAVLKRARVETSSEVSISHPKETPRESTSAAREEVAMTSVQPPVSSKIASSVGSRSAKVAVAPSKAQKPVGKINRAINISFGLSDSEDESDG